MGECIGYGATGLWQGACPGDGRPPYDPADLLKLYGCGCLNGVRSWRALERERQRTVEVMWLLGRLAPHHKTIADFRRQNAEALVGASASFIGFARRERLIRGEAVAIDGSKIRAVASRKAVLKADDERPEMMGKRRSTVEHPFATIKHHVLRDARLLLRGLRGARAELSLAVLACNLKRVSNWQGKVWTPAALKA